MEYKKLAHFQNGISVLGRILEQGIKNWPISRTGHQFQGKFFQNGVPVWSPGRHIPTQKIPKCPPPPGSHGTNSLLPFAAVNLRFCIVKTYSQFLIYSSSRSLVSALKECSSERERIVLLMGSVQISPCGFVCERRET